MRDTLNEPGFWLMVFGTVIIALVLFAPDGRCESPTDRMLPFPVVSQEFGPLTYTVVIKEECTGWGIGLSDAVGINEANCETEYHHLIGRTGRELKLVDITNKTPTKEVLQLIMLKYLLTIANGGE